MKLMKIITNQSKPKMLLMVVTLNMKAKRITIKFIAERISLHDHSVFTQYDK